MFGFSTCNTEGVPKINISTLRPGFLISLKTSVVGNVHYQRQDIEPDHLTAAGGRQARWETERTISDPNEFEIALKVRSKATSVIRAVCARSAFGLLCPEANNDKLERAIAEARQLADEFNAAAMLTRVSVYVIVGRIVPDDVEAVRAINSEIRDLLETMASGIKNLDVKAVRDAADRARNVGAMLSPDSVARVQVAIDAARSAARQIVKAGGQAAQEIDRTAIQKIVEQRTAFLDLDPIADVAAPAADARIIDLDDRDVPALTME